MSGTFGVGLAYEPSRIFTTENFNPQHANPVHHIICQGDLPPFILPVYSQWNPNDGTLQRICAKSQYGGRRISSMEHLGELDNPLSIQGYCEAPHDGDEASEGTVFDFFWLGPLRRSVLELYLRLALYCRQRCYCADYPRRNLHKPKGAGNNRIGESLVSQTSQITLDVQPDLPEEPVAGEGNEQVASTTIREVSQIDLDLNRPRASIRTNDFTISLNPANAIVCDNVALPSRLRNRDDPFRIFRLDEFQTTQQLCAVALSGGDPRANAGGYCHRGYQQGLPSQPSKVVGQVWFTDEMTPRWEWGWSSMGLDFTFDLRRFCWQQCRCANVENDLRRTRTGAMVWPLDEDDEPEIDRIGDSTGRDITTLIKYRNDASQSQWLIPLELNPFQNNPDSSRTCAGGVGNICWATIWNTTIEGPLPSGAFFSKRGRSNKKKRKKLLPQCGQECTGPALKSCSSGPEQGCQCVLPSSRLAARLGLDPVAPKAICLVMSSLVASWNTQADSRLPGLPSFGKRELSSGWGGCVCNITYASKACCQSVDGLVWEDKNLKTGQVLSSL